jgi:hypothetical protein
MNLEPSYTPDFADEIDTEDEVIADRYGVSLAIAREIIQDRQDAIRQCEATKLGAIIGALISGQNLAARVHALALAFGLDQLNGFQSQSDVARKLGCTRALISHYVVGWRDILESDNSHVDCTKFRKRNDTRKTFSESAKKRNTLRA